MNKEIAYQHAQTLALDHNDWSYYLQEQLNQPIDQICEDLASYYAINYLNPLDLPDYLFNSDILPYTECLKKQCFFAVNTQQQLTLIISSPWHSALITQLWNQVKMPFDVSFSLPGQIIHYLKETAGEQTALSTWQASTPASSRTEEAYEEISLHAIAQQDNHVVRLVNSTVYDAYKSQASDIHLENTVSGLVIRYRLDGILVTAQEIHERTIAEQVISRLKVLAELDIGERRIPQDGRFTVHLEHKKLDFRVSIMPGNFGEDAVLRLLDKGQIADQSSGLSLNSLGIEPAIQTTLNHLASMPYGMLLVTGPTGSGKTTTLYALLGETRRSDEKVITIEDPVEYILEGALQIPVNEKKGLTFARGLRSILRHDPDRILVGEIRDRETGEIAVQAALTGHLVYTTVHANTVFDVISRFRHIGIDALSFVSALNGIVAQRLIRLLCQHCSEQDPHHADHRLAKGCTYCRHTGYTGRRAIAEVLVMTDELREMMLANAPIRQIKELAFNQGMKRMRDWALDAVIRGETTLEEVNRVTLAS